MIIQWILLLIQRISMVTVGVQWKVADGRFVFSEHGSNG